MKHIELLLPVLIVCMFALAAPHSRADAPNPNVPVRIVHLKGQLVNPDGKPAANAVVTVSYFDFPSDTVVSTQTVNADTNGRFAVDVEMNKWPSVMASSSNMFAPISIENPANGPIVLEPATSVKIRIVGDDGKPIVGTKIGPNFLQYGSNGNWTFIEWPIDPRWNAVTDAEGVATISGLPQNYALSLRFFDKQYVDPNFRFVLASSPTTPDQTVKLVTGASISGAVTYSTTGLPASNMQIGASGLNAGGMPSRGNAKTDNDGHYTISRLMPGSYCIEFNGEETKLGDEYKQTWTAVAANASVKAGDVIDGVNLSLIHGSMLIGTVTNKFTGKPDPGILVRSNGADHPSGYADESTTVTGPDGTYSLCLAPGSQQVFASTFYGGVLPPEDNKSVMVADGQTKTLDFVVPDPGKPGPVGGVVYGVDGKPAVGAKIYAIGSLSYNDSVESDDQGSFTFTNPGLFPTAKIYASLGKLISPLSEAVGANQNMSLRLGTKGGLAIEGVVKDSRGNPLPNAKISLFRQQGVNEGGYEADATTADSRGVYIFPAELPGQTYQLDAECTGYASNFVQTTFTGIAGQTLRQAPIVLVRADSFVGGKILDHTGSPVDQAVVSDEQNQGNTVTTDASGRFYLKNVPEKHVILMVTAPLGRQASIEEPSGTTTNVITVMNQAEQEAAGKKFEAMLDADKTNHGDGTSAVVLLKRAEHLAEAGHKSLLITFHASWCGPCFMLHKFFTDPKVAPVINKYFVVQAIDVWENRKTKPWENVGGADLYKKFGSNSNGVPFTIILSSTGKRLGDSRFGGQNMGMPSEPAEVAYFLGELKKAQSNMNQEDIDTLKSGFARTAALFN